MDNVEEKKPKKQQGKVKKHRPSSGESYKSKARAIITRLTMKIRRWERYAREGKQCSRKSYEKSKTPTLSRLTWDTKGLKKQLAFQEKLLKGY